MPQRDDEASEMEKALKHGKDAVVANLDAAEVLEPGIGSLYFPAFAVAAQLAFVLKLAVATEFPVGDDQFCLALVEAHPQGVGIVAAIGNDALQMRARP